MKVSEIIQKKENCINECKGRTLINNLLDSNSFIEIGALLNGNNAGVVTGYGTVDGALVYVYANDYSVDGGVVTKKGIKKILNIMEMALKMGAPLVQIYDSCGAKLEEGLELLYSYSELIAMNSKLSGVIPQIAVVEGGAVGINALSAAISDFTIINTETGSAYVNSSSALSNQTSGFASEAVYAKGNATVENGSVQIVAENSEDVVLKIKKILSYIPHNNLEMPQMGSQNSNLLKTSLENINIDAYEMITVVNNLVDTDSLVELDKDSNSKVITGLARINGLTVGIIANEEDELNIKACDKVSKFVKLCNVFNISIVTVVDCIGFKKDLKEEKQGLALAGAKLIYAISEAVVPKVALIIGKAYGSAYVTLASRSTAFDVVYAWPTAKVALGDPSVIAKTLNSEKISASDNPKATEKEVVDSYTKELNILDAAYEGLVDDIVDPKESAIKLFMTLDMLQTKRVINLNKKHSTMSL